MSQPPYSSSGYPAPDQQPYGYGQSGSGYGQYGGQPDHQPQAQPSYQGYGQPSQPWYEQPAQQYTGYSPQPPAPYASYPQVPAVPPAKKSKAGRIVLIVVGVLVLLCGGGGTAVYFAVKDVVDAAGTELVAPDTLGGRPMIETAELQAAVDAMVTGMKKDLPNATSTVGALYGDPAKRDMVMIAGASAFIANPSRALDEFVRGMGSAGLKLTGVKPVEPGPLGGVAKCGDGKIAEIDMGTCIWADRGSLGLVVMYFKSGDQAGAEFVNLRGEVEKRS